MVRSFLLVALTFGPGRAFAQETPRAIGTFASQTESATRQAMQFLADGGPALWAIAALSVITLTLILWKTWRLALMGAWSYRKSQKAVELYESAQFLDRERQF